MNLGNIVTIISIVVCIGIVYEMVLYMTWSKGLSVYFKNLGEDFDKGIKNDVVQFENDNLNLINNEFTMSLNKVENVNTQVIIEKYLYYGHDKLKNRENVIDYLANLATILGLLGTFVGLTCAIVSMGKTLSFNNIDDFLNQLKPAIYSMGGAFTTSIFGLLASITMNLLGSNHDIAKQEFIDKIESFLDNEQAGKKNKDSKQLVDLINVITESISIMNENIQKSTQETSNLYKEINSLNKGLMEINNKIENNNKNLLKVTEQFKLSIDGFNKPINDFTKGIDQFIGVYKGMDNKIENMDKLVNETFKNSIEEFIKYLDKNTKSQEDMIDIQREITSGLLSGFDNSIERLQNISGTLNTYRDSMNEINQEYIKQINSSGKNSIELKRLIDSLNREVLSIGDKISDKVLQSIGDAMNIANKEMIRDMNILSEKLPNELENVSKRFNKIQQEQQAQNKEVLETMKQTIKSIYKQVEDVQTINLNK